MTSRERVLRTLQFDSPDRAPRELWSLAGVGMLRRDELEEVRERFPGDMIGPPPCYGTSPYERGTPAEVGTYVDAWNCEWSVGEIGVAGEVKNPPLADWAALDSWRPPFELLDNADLSPVAPHCAGTDKFVRTGTTVRPFERLQFLRGTENLFTDLMCQEDRFKCLCEQLHAFFIRDLEMWAATDVDGIGFMDDWGAQNSLLIDPELWRTLFKPMYRTYCEIIKGAGKYVFFHSDGHIRAIIPDLIEIGVDALNSQIFCMDIEELAGQFKGNVTFWGEIDRQNILPFGSVDEVRTAVRRVRRALDDGSGGVIAQCEWGVNDPKENIITVFETWDEPRP